MDKKLEEEINKKDYKNLAETRAPNIDEINEAHEIVRQFIIKKNLIIYGGMGLDLNLKKKGHKGIYKENTLPDYDFMSPNNYADSIELADILHKRGFYNVGAINAFHITTRRIRFNYVNVADISYCPPHIYEKLPTILINGFRVLHIDFQRIDIHISLASLMERFPREEYLDRYPKDMIRYNIIHLLFPAEKIKPAVKKSEPNNKPIYSDKYLLHYFVPRKKLIKIKPINAYYTGIAAYAIYYKYISGAAKKVGAKIDMKQFMPVKFNDSSCEILIDKIEIMKPILEMPKEGIFYSKILNIFFSSIVLEDKIIYNTWGFMFAGVELENKIKVVSAHYTLAQLLFKYLMTGYKIYHEIYVSIIKMIIWAEENYSDKYREFWRNSPLTINDNTINNIGYDNNRVYALKDAKCEEKGINKMHRPIFGYYPAKKKIDNIINFDVGTLYSYKSGGIKLDKFVLRNLDC